MINASAKLLDDLYGVGWEKPLGYLPLESIVGICNHEPINLVSSLEEMGLRTELFGDGECLRSGGALYAYHEAALADLLERRAEVLHDARWPITAPEFVRVVATTRADLYTRLFTVIADTFADYANMYRVAL